MAQSLSLSHSPTLSSLHHQPSPFEPTICKSSESSPYPFSLCSCSLPVILATKRITLRLIHHSYHSSWLRVHMKLFVLFSLPTLYLTTSYYWPFFISFLCIVSVFLLVVSLNLALQRVPSIRWLFGRTLCIKFSSPASGSKPLPRVVWSIGSKPKLMKKPDSGCWVQVYNNGDVYEGEFHNGKCSGSGVFYYHLSGRYEGEWIGGKYDGYGIETWAKGRRYRGQYRQGLRHGVGVYRSYTGDVYAGEWCNGQCHGCGVHTCQDGSTYVGEFKSGVKHGLGYYHFRNGDVYAGEYFADKMHGFGVYRFGNGHQYEGAWHEGRRQGFGLYTFRHGETQSGHWQNGVLNGSTSPKIRNGSSITDDPSKLLHTVQEAKRAAEKAINMATVDERVKRAIAAANKAATAARVTAVKATQNQMHPDNNHSGTHCLSLQA